MCKIAVKASLLGAALGCMQPAIATEVAITELLANPFGSDSRGEWVELFNYGSTTATLGEWRLEDEGRASATLPTVELAPGDFLIVARGKSAFETAWMGGRSDERIVEAASGSWGLTNSGDELRLVSPGGNVVWQLAYSGSAITEGRSLTLDPGEDFVHTVYGSKDMPGVRINGPDVTGTLGYEQCAAGPSCPGAASGAAGDWGSPLAGTYGLQVTARPTAVRAPASLALACIGLLPLAWILYRGRARRAARPPERLVRMAHQYPG